jgi:hypothetical protein
LLLMTYDKNPKWTDIYELPVASDTLVGVNSLRNKLKLVRRDSAVPTPGRSAS